MSILDLARKACAKIKAAANGHAACVVTKPTCDKSDLSDQSPAADQENPSTERKNKENPAADPEGPEGPSAEQKGDQSPGVLPFRRWYAPGHEGLETPFDNLPEL
jgi:hypothetical protein